MARAWLTSGFRFKSMTGKNEFNSMVYQRVTEVLESNVGTLVIRDIDVETGEVYINMDLVAKDIGQTVILCGHNVKGLVVLVLQSLTNLLYIPFIRACLSQTANAEVSSGASPRFSNPRPGRGRGRSDDRGSGH